MVETFIMAGHCKYLIKQRKPDIFCEEERNKMDRDKFKLKRNLFVNHILVLGLARMEIILLIATHRESCFRFLTKTVLMIHQCFG